MIKTQPSSKPVPKPVLRVLAGVALAPPPCWIMRQAGRYLPEYRALRREKGSFLALCHDPVAAADVTLQPLRRFGMDAAILFSDILVVPHALGQNLAFRANEGPTLTPANPDPASLEEHPEYFASIYETVRCVKAGLPPAAALIGFAGAPWTVATYMVAGEGSRNQAPARTLAYQDPARFSALLARLHTTTLTYLSGQVEAGAEALMLFDSWSGVLPPAQFEKWVIAPTARLVAALHEAHPHIPVIGFPRGAQLLLPAYARETGVDALGLAETVPLPWALANLPPDLPLQGNLDPMALLAGGESLQKAVKTLLQQMAGRPHIFNLGHGIERTTPIAHVEALLALIRQ